MKLLKFTRPNGSPVWVAATWVISVAGAHVDSDPSSKCRIELSGGIQDVREPPEEVIADLTAE
jgi:hypothetical protein